MNKSISDYCNFCYFNYYFNRYKNLKMVLSQLSEKHFTGSLAIDLNTMPLPMKEISRKMKSLFSEQTEKTIDLFAARHVRGWWPFMTNMPKYGKRIKVVVSEL